MISTFHGLEMGKRSLASHQQAINTTGHNLNNMNTEGYSRQTVKLSTFEPLYVPGLARSETAGQIGQGTTVTSIDRVRDQFIDNRIISAGKDLGFFDMRNKYLQQMEMVYAEPSVYNDPSQYNTLRRAFDEFMSSWSDVANNPDDKAPRNVLVEKANILTNSVRHHFNQMTDIRNNVDIEIKNKVGELNEIASKIAKLNERILKSEAVGDHPNDLYDSRDVFIDKLSKMADIQISREDPDELILYIGGKMIVQGAESEKLNLTAQADNYGYSDVYWADGEKVAFRGGELGSLVDVRDTDLRMEQKKINSFAVNISDLVNEIHRDGFGLNETTGNDFFSTHPFTTDPTGNFDANRDGADDSTFIFKVTGANTLDGNDKLGIRGTMNVNNVEIDYYETDTLDRVVRRINESGAGVNAFLNPQGKLTVKADYYGDNQSPDFVIRRLEDNGLFLTGYAGILNQSGAEGGFNSNVVNETGTKLNAQSVWSIAPLTDPAQYMAIEKKIENDVSFIAVASGIDSDGDGIKDISNGIGDSQNALRISSLKDNKVMVGMSLSVSQYFENIVSDVGARGQKAENGFRVQETIMNNLENLRKSVSGVNLDEEFANLIKFQHGYNASAKFISEMDKMLETIITKL
ncbi:MAG: flagellar hook-associated protein FlgK [Spirochaetes bacterium GWF1_31_7]|nr:MAG: flagellar hook-associated protein FlgK [Spirochaetes bacterium GWE1_32_154]OHD52233.1 MAG: flagellar hook-associated protein FlgK [Spirochaetes bacterium GWE2_31_10]OHD53033.1 MAG: flagellar hook-associated protein FlgK [Spirochaetes bacterium GWF1_31_7]HBD96179.1 flagellar hook-associated protein FlgK [Spirochaetia bacterium]HBI36483.1 flagellar hook-associated protein FlgK [Spirochaetia bacterium]